MHRDERRFIWEKLAKMREKERKRNAEQSHPSQTTVQFISHSTNLLKIWLGASSHTRTLAEETIKTFDFIPRRYFKKEKKQPCRNLSLSFFKVPLSPSNDPPFQKVSVWKTVEIESAVFFPRLSLPSFLFQIRSWKEGALTTCLHTQVEKKEGDFPLTVCSFHTHSPSPSPGSNFPPHILPYYCTTTYTRKSKFVFSKQNQWHFKVGFFLSFFLSIFFCVITWRKGLYFHKHFFPRIHTEMYFILNMYMYNTWKVTKRHPFMLKKSNFACEKKGEKPCHMLPPASQRIIEHGKLKETPFSRRSNQLEVSSACVAHMATSALSYAPYSLSYVCFDMFFFLFI